MWCKQKRRKEREAQQQAAKKLKSEATAEGSVDNAIASESRSIPSTAAPPARQVSKDNSPIVNNKSQPGSLSVPLPTAPALNTSILESLSGNPSSTSRQPNLLMKNTHLDELTQITAQLQQLQSNEQSNKEIQQAIYKAKQKQLAILSQLTVSQQAKIAQTLSMAIASQSDQKGVQDTLQQFLTLIKPDVAATSNQVKSPPLNSGGRIDKQESSSIKSSPAVAPLPRQQNYDYNNQLPQSALANMQTFDYGNQSNKEFERVAVEQLEWEKHHGPTHPVQPPPMEYSRRQQEDRYGHEGWHS